MRGNSVKEQTEKAAKKTVRADAQRNENTILEVAKSLFSKYGVDVPVRKIATESGVGVGTVYRRFPKRSDLVAAVFRREVDACVRYAETVQQNHQPGEALTLWFIRYTEFIATKRGLAAALHSKDPAFASLPIYFRSNFEPALKALLDAAAKSGEIRTDIAPYDLLRAIGGLAMANGDDGTEYEHSMVKLMIDGLRFGADQAR